MGAWDAYVTRGSNGGVSEIRGEAPKKAVRNLLNVWRPWMRNSRPTAWLKRHACSAAGLAPMLSKSLFLLTSCHWLLAACYQPTIQPSPCRTQQQDPPPKQKLQAHLATLGTALHDKAQHTIASPARAQQQTHGNSTVSDPPVYAIGPTKLLFAAARVRAPVQSATAAALFAQV